jgi:hypothetical protein
MSSLSAATPDVERTLRVARWRHVNARVVSVLVALVILFFLVYTADTIGLIIRNLPGNLRMFSDWNRDALPWQEYLYAVQVRNLMADGVLVYLGFYVLPFILALPVASPIVALWRAPPRFLFLRPFNRKPLTRGLARLVHRDAARFGHTYTLADADLRVRWYVRIPLLLGQIALLSFRRRTIRRTSQLDRLERAVSRTWFRNINWCLSWRKVFAVASDDACWQQVVERLLRQSTVVFIDLTEFRPNVRWELELIRRSGLEPRVVYLLREDRMDALEAMREQMGYVPAPDQLHLYGNRGAKNAASLRNAIAGRVVRFGRVELDASRSVLGLSIAGVLMFIAGCLPMLALAFPNLQLGLPSWADYDASGYINHTGPLLVSVFGVITLVVVGIATVRNRNMGFLTVVQTLLLLGAFWGLVSF